MRAQRTTQSVAPGAAERVWTIGDLIDAVMPLQRRGALRQESRQDADKLAPGKRSASVGCRMAGIGRRRRLGCLFRRRIEYALTKPESVAASRPLKPTEFVGIVGVARVIERDEAVGPVVNRTSLEDQASRIPETAGNSLQTAKIIDVVAGNLWRRR
jgi:hypothetical protein